MANRMKRVLVVEDDRVIGKVLRFNLERIGLDVTLARNGPEALSLLQEQDFDMVVTDYQMPGMSGRELCLAMRSSPQWSQIPVVMITAKAGEMDLPREREELGLVEVFPKPFSPRVVTSAIQGFLTSAVSKP